jgi:hypothetical protein
VTVRTMSSHRRRQPGFPAAATVAIIWGAASLAGCSGSPPANGGSTPTSPAGAPAGSTAAGTGVAGTSAAPAPNPLFLLKPGGQSVRQGFVNAGHRRLDHRRVYTVTDVHKVVDGVTATVVLDQDYDGGELAEQSLEILALDGQGNVRYLGSYTEAYEGGQFVNSTDAWLSGVKGGRSGILVPVRPQVGAQFTEAVVPGEGVATARVTKVGEHRCVPFRCFDDLVVVEEKGAELKFYAPGVGGVLTQPLRGDAQETEELINVTTLSHAGLAEIGKEVLALDRHARSVSADVYGHSTPAARGT